MEIKSGFNILLIHVTLVLIEYVNNIPTMQFFQGNFKKYSVKIILLSLTECVGDFQNNMLWGTD